MHIEFLNDIKNISDNDLSKTFFKSTNRLKRQLVIRKYQDYLGYKLTDYYHIECYQNFIEIYSIDGVITSESKEY